MKYGAINIDPETMGGTPVFTGTRVPIKALFDYIETGETLEEFLENFPSVPRELALEVLRKSKFESDWWEELSENKKSIIRQGLNDADSGKLLQSSEFWKKLKDT